MSEEILYIGKRAITVNLNSTWGITIPQQIREELKENPKEAKIFYNIDKKEMIVRFE